MLIVSNYLTYLLQKKINLKNNKYVHTIIKNRS